MILRIVEMSLVERRIRGSLQEELSSMFVFPEVSQSSPSSPKGSKQIVSQFPSRQLKRSKKEHYRDSKQ
jgi:hypothetical protein